MFVWLLTGGPLMCCAVHLSPVLRGPVLLISGEVHTCMNGESDDSFCLTGKKYSAVTRSVRWVHLTRPPGTYNQSPFKRELNI